MKVIHTSVEGNVSYDALLFIPSQPPMNFYSNDYEKSKGTVMNRALQFFFSCV